MLVRYGEDGLMTSKEESELDVEAEAGSASCKSSVSDVAVSVASSDGGEVASASFFGNEG